MAQNPPAKAPTAPLVIDTTRLTGAEPDPRGDNNPGVLADQPGSPGVNPVTNRDDSLTAEDGVTLRAPTSNEPINNPVPPAAEEKATGPYVEMRIIRDYWPRPGNKHHPKDEDGNSVNEWRVKAGDVVGLPRSEAEDLMENGTAERVNKRQG